MLQVRIAAAFPFSSLAIRCRNRRCWLVGPIDPYAGAGLRASPRGLTIAPLSRFRDIPQDPFNPVDIALIGQIMPVASEPSARPARFAFRRRHGHQHQETDRGASCRTATRRKSAATEQGHAG
jgi:hypothetical protein